MDAVNAVFIVSAIAFLFMFAGYFLKTNMSQDIGYANHFSGPNKKPFEPATLERFKKMRKENNPNCERVGAGTGRCQYCGHKHNKNNATSFKLAENNPCSNCNLI
ncbi:hypothetical protein K9M47_02625 [Candidatus Gracilibacteria bacterium]|nr:hypothetical protein [Candidatus Gracilibacteria bacterium]